MPFLLRLCSVSPSDWVSKGWKIEQKNRKVFEKLSTPDSTPQFSSSAEWKVHLNSIFFVNALLIRHSTIFIPLRLNTCGLPSHWRHKNVIKFQLIFKYVPLRNCFPFRIAFQRVMPLNERFSREKAQARSGKSDAAAKMSLKSFFAVIWFHSLPISINPRFSFVSMIESGSLESKIKSKSVKGSISGLSRKLLKEAEIGPAKCNSIGMPFRYFASAEEELKRRNNKRQC